MNRFRYWLADLISGGELTQLDGEFEILFRHNCEISKDIVSQQRFTRVTNRLSDESLALKHALTRIAAEVKPTSNATVRRMARIAQEALK